MLRGSEDTDKPIKRGVKLLILKQLKTNSSALTFVHLSMNSQPQIKRKFLKERKKNVKKKKKEKYTNGDYFQIILIRG